MTALAIHPLLLHADAKTEATIKTIVESVALLADRNDFETLESLYAPEVEVDYTSLTGGEVKTQSNTMLMQSWAGVLPGFDLTRHAVSNIQVSANDLTATATADVIAEHYVDDLYWQVEGSYVYRLRKEAGRWHITHHQFNLKEETGTRDVFAVATEKARLNPPAYLIRQRTQEIVMNFLTALETKDMALFATVWAEDAVQNMPYSPEGFPKRVSGKKNLLQHYASWPEISGAADFTSALVFYPMQDPEKIFVEFKGDVHITSTNRHYKQIYGGLFHVQNGQITLFREYYNPEPFRYAFALGENS